MKKSTTCAQFPLVIIAGLSGSGKSTALDVFEDIGFFKLDGLPAALMSSMVAELSRPEYSEYMGIVLGVDLRQENFVAHFDGALEEMNRSGHDPFIVFIEAKPDVLVQRYASTRRPHPLEKGGLGLEQALDLERERLDIVRQKADLVIDTSDYSIHTLRRTLQHKWKAMQADSSPCLRVHIVSFGFKYGTPSEADMIFDLRFLSNPYFELNLRPLSGQDQAVASYVLESETGASFMERLVDFLSFILAQMEREGRYRLTIGIGCTGGRHRSVAVAEFLTRIFSKEYTISLEHRHLELG